MIRLYFVICILTIISISSCDSRIKHNQNSGLSKVDPLKKDSIDWKLKIGLANSKFKIHDYKAIDLLLANEELRTIKDYKYKDTTIINDLYISDIPNDSDQRWTIELSQNQPRLQKALLLMTFWVNANSGKIEIMDHYISIDKIFTLDEWRKQINNKNNNRQHTL